MSNAGNFDSLWVGGVQIIGGTSLVSATASTTITDAQMKTMPTAAVQVVAAPGAGKMIVPRQMWVFANLVTGYTNIFQNSYMVFTINGNEIGGYIANDPYVNAGFNSLTQLLGGATRRYVSFTGHYVEDASDPDGWGVVDYPQDQAYGAWLNVPLLLGINNAGSGNLTGGSGSNGIVAVVDYFILTPP